MDGWNLSFAATWSITIGQQSRQSLIIAQEKKTLCWLAAHSALKEILQFCNANIVNRQIDKV